MKAIDLVIDHLAAHFGEERIINLLEGRNNFSELERLLEKFDYEISVSNEDVKSSVEALESLLKELNEILSVSNYSIHRKALMEILRYGDKYRKDRALPKTLDTIFQVVNEPRGTRINEKLKMAGTNFFEVRINHKWRLYYEPSERLIIGFDYEHKRDDHSDVLAELKRRMIS